MSYSAFDATLVCEPRVSRLLLAAAALAYAVPAVTALAGLPPVTGGGLAAVAGLAGLRELRGLARRPATLYWGRDGLWRRGDPAGPGLALDAATWSTPCLIVLVLRGPAGTRRVALARDALDAPTWRRLRARLQVAGAAAAAPG